MPLEFIIIMNPLCGQFVYVVIVTAPQWNSANL